MKRRNKLITVVVMVILVIQMTGCGKEEVNTWAGYEADAANGLRVKSAEFTYQGWESKVTYDMERNITSISSSSEIGAPFYEKALGIPTLIRPVPGGINSDYGYVLQWRSFTLPGESQLQFDGVYPIEVAGKGSCYFLADGHIAKEITDDGAIATYNYDEKGRLILDSFASGSYSNRYKYTYEGDTSYLKTVVHQRSGSVSDEFSKRLFEYDFDENNNILKVEHYSYTHPEQISGVLTKVLEYEYNDDGNLVCRVETRASDEGDIYITTRYQYDKNANLVEKCVYQTFGSEEYITSKVEYKYGNTVAYQTNTTKYRYEANADYSIVNLIETKETGWEWAYGEFMEGCDEVNDCWKVEYYTQEEIDQYLHEIDQYLHDQEFHRVN